MAEVKLMTLDVSSSQPLTLNYVSKLEAFYRQVDELILKRQHPVSGLLPASTAVNQHGNYTDAWVRDNVYSILAVWGLSIAYRKHSTNPSFTFLLEQSVVKLMRGLLRAMMRQSHKVEAFKHTQHPLDALHAKYDTLTGDSVVADDAWGHLQIDATSIFILMLSQMTVSGLSIIYSLDEVTFVQNLVYYISCAYCTADYGIWERGNKINKGDPEVNASSVGMAKAALEAIAGLNLFGKNGTAASIIQVDPEDIARTTTTLTALLPRESKSKEIDAALLSIISFPAFAISDTALINRTRAKIIKKLKGNYGCKRFLRDGHQTVIEDHGRLHYEAHELKKFEQIECEWPLFFTYLYLDALFRQNETDIQYYRQKLSELGVEQGGYKLLPELYYVKAEQIEAERVAPGSQLRVPNDNLPLVWAQSLYLLGQLIDVGLLQPQDIDPLGLYQRSQCQRQTKINLVFVSDDESTLQRLLAESIPVEPLSQNNVITIRPASQLQTLLATLGENAALGLTGSPINRIGSLLSAQVYHACQQLMVIVAPFHDEAVFFLPLDAQLWFTKLQSEIAYICQHWKNSGTPLMIVPLASHLASSDSLAFDAFAPLIQGINDIGTLDCVKITSLHHAIAEAEIVNFNHLTEIKLDHSLHHWSDHLAAKSQVLSPMSTVLSPDDLRRLDLVDCVNGLTSRFQQSQNLYEQMEIVRRLIRLKGRVFQSDFGGTGKQVALNDVLWELYAIACQRKNWSVVRQGAGLLKLVDMGISEAMTHLLALQKQIIIGNAYSHDSVIREPLSADQIAEKIRCHSLNDERAQIMSQELILYLDLIIKEEPHLIQGLLSIRIGYLIALLVSEIALKKKLSDDQAYETLMQISPFEVKSLVHKVLANYERLNQSLHQRESLHVKAGQLNIDWGLNIPLETQAHEEEAQVDWFQHRQVEGALNRVPNLFYQQVWMLLNQSPDIVIGNRYDSTNRLDRATLASEMTPGETNFALRVENLLNKIQAPEYRQLTVEALIEISKLVTNHSALEFSNALVMDVIIGHAVRLRWWDVYPERVARYEEDKAISWQSFYQTSPVVCSRYYVMALRFLIEAL